MEDRLFTLRHASERLDMTENALRWWVKLGRIPTVRFGRRRYITSATIRQLTSIGLESEPISQRRKEKEKREIDESGSD